MSTIELVEIAKVIRSKNAKAFHLTFDVIFDDAATYEHVKRSGAITAELFEQIYGRPVQHFVWLDAALAVKATIRRPTPAGGFGETDQYGCQHHAPLFEIAIPWGPDAPGAATGA
jgi:Domain of unknown function (DUF4387)